MQECNNYMLALLEWMLLVSMRVKLKLLIRTIEYGNRFNCWRGVCVEALRSVTMQSTGVNMCTNSFMSTSDFFFEPCHRRPPSAHAMFDIAFRSNLHWKMDLSPMREEKAP